LVVTSSWKRNSVELTLPKKHYKIILILNRVGESR
jgi:hypothetical protein